MVKFKALQRLRTVSVKGVRRARAPRGRGRNWVGEAVRAGWEGGSVDAGRGSAVKWKSIAASQRNVVDLYTLCWKDGQ